MSKEEQLEQELKAAKELLSDCLGWFEAMTGGEETVGEIGILCKKIRKVVKDGQGQT